MDTPTLWIGVDVAKEQLEVAIGAEGDTWAVPNDKAGIAAPTAGSRARP